MNFTSRVTHGRQHGRTIGYPTANLELTDEIRAGLDKEGVYAVRVGLGEKQYAGALFYGNRSLFKEDKTVCEVLLINFTGDLYSQIITIEIIKYLRPVAAVKDEAELKRLIEQDIKDTSQLFNQ